MSKPDTILVYGASGTQGGTIANQLLAAGAAVRAITRSKTNKQALESRGIEVYEGSPDDAEVLAAAHAGANKVLLQLPVDYNPEKVRRYIQLAVAAATVAKPELIVVNTAVYVPDQPTESIAIELKRELIEAVQASGIPYIVVQPVLYFENLLIPGLVANGALAYPVPADAPIPWVSISDLAKLAVYALQHPELAGQTLSAAGPEALTGADLADKVGRALGTPLSFVPLPVQAFEAALSPLLGEETATGLAGLYNWIGAHYAELPQPSASHHDTTPQIKLSDWLKNVAEQGLI